MNKFPAIIIFFAIACLSNAQDRWVSFNDSKSEAPVIDIIEQNEHKLTIEVAISGMFISMIEKEGGKFQKLEIEQNRTTKETGMPQLPMINEIIGIPSDKLANIRIVDVETEILSEYTVFPFQIPLKDIPQQQEKFVMDTGFYKSNRSYPPKQVFLSKSTYWRDLKVSLLHIIPFNYSPSTKKLEVLKKLKIEIEFISTEILPKNNKNRLVSPKFYQMYESAVINFKSLGFEKKQSVNDGVKYLIITDTSSKKILQPFIDWKNQQGYRVKVKTTSPEFNTPEAFKYYIKSLYENDGLEYVLMAGDAYSSGGIDDSDYYLPMYWWVTPGEDSTYSDSWYACLDEPNDYFADLAIGRITYDNLAELETQIQKTLGFYFNPDTTSFWPENSLLIAHKENYPKNYTQCSEDIRLFPYTLQIPDFEKAYGGEFYSNNLVIDFINNNSCGILNYRGHGSETELWNWCPQGSFTSLHVDQLTNENRLFVFFDVCCNNMNITGYNGNCLSESFMKSTAAAVAVNGAIIPSYKLPNNDYNKELYNALFELGIVNIGYTSNYANISVLSNHGYLGRSNVRTYLWLGDASLEPWTLRPKTMSVSYNEKLYIGSTNYSTTVSADGNPIANALVCISNTDLSLHEAAYTDEYGNVEIFFDIPVQNTGSAMLTVTAHNHLPFLTKLQVITKEEPYVINDSLKLNDNMYGNGNGLMDYAESFLLNLSVKNVGKLKAEDVNVSLSSDDPYISFIDSTKYYGSIEPGELFEIEDAFGIAVAENIPDWHYAIIDMTATDKNDTSWHSSFYLEGHAPEPEMISYVIDDSKGNNNGIIDPGETVDIIISFGNAGSSDAFQVSGSLSTNDSYISVNTDQVYIENLNSGSTTMQTFSITADENSPVGHTADFSFVMSFNPGTSFQESFTELIGRLPALILDLDYNNTSGPLMQNILIDFGIDADYTTFFPEDLNMYSIVFVCLGVYNENHVLTFDEGLILTEFLLMGGSLYMEGGDTWIAKASTPVQQMFNVICTSDGFSDMGSISGSPGSFTENMIFNYTGENISMDHIDPIYPAFTIFENLSPNYGTAVAFHNGSYKTIAASHEFGGLIDNGALSTKEQLMIKYLQFFGVKNILNLELETSQTTICKGGNVSYSNYSTGNDIMWYWVFEGGEPSVSQEKTPVVHYYNEGVFDVSLEVSDGLNILSHSFINLIHVNSILDTPLSPTGPVKICSNITLSSKYFAEDVDETTELNWLLQPAEAGIVFPDSNYAIIYWSEGWAGEATLKVRHKNEYCEGEYSKELSIHCSVCTGMEELTNMQNVIIFPNPTNGIFSLQYNFPVHDAEIQIMNALNKIILHKQFKDVNEESINIDLSQYDKGLYYVVLKVENERYVEKIILR